MLSPAPFAPLSSSAPPASKRTAPVFTNCVTVSAFASRTNTLRPVTLSAPPKSFAAFSSVTSWPAALIPVVPAIVTAPAWVIAPPLVSVALPVSVEVPRANAFASRSVRFRAVVDTAPPKSFAALVSVTSPVPALRLVAPLTTTRPELCSIAVFVVPTVRLPAVTS